NPLIVGLAVLAVLVVITVTSFQLLARDPDTGPRLPTETTTTVEGAPSTTVDAGAATGGTSDPATTTTTVAPGPTIVPVGDAIPLDQLQLARTSIGPIEFGLPADQALGRLAASLGPADSDSGDGISTGEFGSCLEGYERIVRWGPLIVIVNHDGAGVPVFAGYRLDSSQSFISPASDLATLSGLKAGDSVADLEEIYGGSFTINYLDDPTLGNIYELRRDSDGARVLWGPITGSTADGVVLGIFSPEPCTL
ncbi:MAG: hypothetical protein HKN07_06895, partial [Acidimicrobiia bacterium]|nr:hypothetical protein [Acidimicrobiia bacterium]